MEALSWVPADTETVTAVPVPAAGHPGAGRCSVWVARGAVMAADTVTVAAAMMAARALRGDIGVAPAGGPTAAGYGLVGAAALPLWVVAFSRYRLYQASRLADRRSELGGLVHGVALGVALTALAAYGLGQFVSQGWLGLLFVLALIGVAAEREVVRRVFDRLHRNGRGLRPVAVVGTGHEGSGLVAMLEAEPRLGYKVVAMVGRQTPFGPHVAAEVPVLAHDDALVDRLRAVGAGGVLIAVTDVGTDVANRLVRTLPDAGLHVELSSSLQDIDAGRLSVRPLGHRPVLHVEPVRRGGGRAAAKRTFDLAASLAGLLVALPVLVAAALAVKATSPGPVLYRQVRVGRHGRPFTILKLRSMYVDSDWRLGDLVADASRGPVVKLFADPRVTRVGRILRKFSVDELPQLLNVLKGDMSLVGPRPEQPAEVALWAPAAWDRLRVRPGLTGLWQVSGRSDSRTSKERWDLYYVDNWSLWRDVAILARTVPVLVTARGAC